MTLFDYFKSFFCEENLIVIEELKKQIIEKAQQNLAQAKAIAKHLKQTEYLEKENDTLLGENEELKAHVPLIYSPSKTISHSWTFEKEKHQVPLQDFIQPHLVEIHEALKKKKLYIKNESEIDVKVPKIVQVMKNLLKGYKLDESNFGQKERWLFPIETIKHGYDDCEGYTNVIVSGLIASNPVLMTPRTFAVGGKTYNGIGHQTVAVFDSTGIQRHLNSTSPFNLEKNLQDYAIFNADETDHWNIKEIWWAYNNISATATLDKDSIESYIYEFASNKPDPIQTNDYTELRNVVQVANTSGLEKVKYCVVEIDGRIYQGNNAGIVYIKIPDSIADIWVTVKYSSEGFKTREFRKVFEKGKTTSFIVTLYRGSN